MFDEKDQNINNQNNKNSGNFGENKSPFENNIDNLEKQNDNVKIQEKNDLPEDIFSDVDKIESENSNLNKENLNSNIKTKRFSKKMIILVITILLICIILIFFLLKSLPETSKTIYNNIPQESGLNNLVEDEYGNPVKVPDPIGFEDNYLLEEEINPGIFNELENEIINNNKEVDISILDSDGDGLTDYQEIHIWGTDPYNPDTDGDGYSDFDEIKAGYNPLGDGLLE